MKDYQLSSTAKDMTFNLVLSIDHLTPATGKTPTVVISKNGAAFGSPSGAVSEVANGNYKLAANATDRNTLGDFVLYATATGCDPVTERFSVVAYDPFDAVRLGLTALPNAAAEAAGGLFTRGTGAGQINQDANGRVDVSLKAILGTTLTETAGLIAAGFKQFFNIASPTSTMNTITAVTTTTNLTTNNDKTGYGLSAAAVQAIWDALTSALVTSGSIGKLIVDNLNATISSVFNRIGAPAGASVSADIAAVKVDTGASQTSESTLLSRLSALRAGYLDNLNVGGNVASSAEVTVIQNNTRVVRVVPSVFERPDSGSTAFRIELYIYDEVGNMEAPDSAPTISVANQAGTSRDVNLDSTTMSLVSTGRYRSTYTIDTAHALEELLFTFSVVEGGLTRLYGNGAQVADTTAVDFTGSDRTILTDIQTRLPAVLVSGRMDSSVGAMAADVVTATAIATDAIGSNELAASAVSEIAAAIPALDAVALRAAIGLASANLDTQLTTIDDYLDTEVGAIKAKTDLLAFTSGKVDAQVRGMDADVITASAIATDALGSVELSASAVTEINAAVLAAIAGLNNLSASQINAEVLDVMSTDTHAEPTDAPTFPMTYQQMIMFLAAQAINKIIVNKTTGIQTLRNHADSADISTQEISDDGTIFIRDVAV